MDSSLRIGATVGGSSTINSEYASTEGQGWNAETLYHSDGSSERSRLKSSSSANGHEDYHEPVLLQETISSLRPAKDAVLIDATIGEGGHAETWLKAGGRVVGVDRDGEAIERTRERLSAWMNKVILHHLPFSRLGECSENLVEAVLFDLGTSRLQLEDSRRGFSYLNDGPLDMRMDPLHGKPACHILREMTQPCLAQALADFGDVQSPNRVARAILRIGPPETTQDLVRAIESCFHPRRRIKGLSTVFQAIRIIVNNELQELELGLAAGMKRLKDNGRIAILTYHSGEERYVRWWIRRESGRCICPPGLPVCACGAKKRLEPLSMGLRPSAEEVSRNPRSRSARLWVGEKIHE